MDHVGSGQRQIEPSRAGAATAGSGHSASSGRSKIRRDILDLYEEAMASFYAGDEDVAKSRSQYVKPRTETSIEELNVEEWQVEQRHLRERRVEEIRGEKLAVAGARVEETNVKEVIFDHNEGTDPNIVYWDNENDRANPLNWPVWKKTLNVLIIFLLLLATTLPSSVIAPVVPDIIRTFSHSGRSSSNNSYLSAFIVSITVLGNALGPLLFAPLSGCYGRTPMYHVCNLLFVGASCWCAKARSMRTFAAARFLVGCGGSGAMALGLCSITDMFKPGKRRVAFAIMMIVYSLASSLSPIVGVHINRRWGPSWIFSGTAILGAFCTIVAILGPSETCEQVLLRRKTIKLRLTTHNLQLRSKTAAKSQPYCIRTIILTIRMLVSPPIFLVSFLSAFSYACLYILYITLPEVLRTTYRWKSKNIGYAYLGIAAGSLFGLVLGMMLSNAVVKARRKKGDERPEFRLFPMIAFWPLVGCGLIVYAWTASKAVHWIWPLVGSGVFGAGVTSTNILAAAFPTFQGFNFFCIAYILDAYSTHSDPAIGASILIHAILGGVIPLFSNKLHHQLGVGWAFTLLGLVALIFCPVPYILYTYGERMRRRFDLRAPNDGR